MFLVAIYDREEEEMYEVMAQDLEELSKILEYIKLQPHLSLSGVEERWFVCGLDGFKELMEGRNG